MKKKMSYLLVICFSLTGIIGYTQDTLIHLSDNDMKEIMISCERYLHGAQSYNTSVNFIEIIGGGLLGVGLGVQQGGLTGIGFLIGFGGLEMSKFSPIPLTKAKMKMILLRSSWADSIEYNQLFHQVVTAETLGYTAMGLAFGGQALVLMAALCGKNEALQTVLIAGSIICAAGSIGTSVGATIATGIARKSLGKHIGSLGLNIGPQGIGAVYRLP